MKDLSVEHVECIMIKRDMDDFPQYRIPDGFSIRAFEEGYQRPWAEVLLQAQEVSSIEEGLRVIDSTFLVDRELASKRCLFSLNKDGQIVSCASLWRGSDLGLCLDRLHWVSTIPAYEGLGLAKALLTRLFTIKEDKEPVYLTTQTESWRAVGLYRKFGFESYDSPGFQKAWGIIESKLGDRR